MGLTVHNNTTSSPHNGMVSTLARTLKNPLHSEETLTKSKQGELSFFHGLFVSATKNFLRLAGSALGTFTAAILGINLFKDSNSDNSFFNGWKFISLLTLGTIAPFVADYSLEPKQNSLSPTIPAQKANNEITDEVTKEDFEQTVILSVFKNLFPPNLMKIHHYTDTEKDYTSELKSRGLEIREDKNGVHYLQTLHKSTEASKCHIFTQNGKEMVAGVRIKLSDLKEAVRVHINKLKKIAYGDESGEQEYTLNIEIITKALDTEDNQFKSYGLKPVSASYLLENDLLPLIPAKRKQHLDPSGTNSEPLFKNKTIRG